jgi:hypothetical protein
MDQRSIVLYLHLKRLSARAMHDDHVATLDPKAVASNTVRCHLREARLGIVAVPLDSEPRSHHLDDCDRAILAALGEKSFSSV